MKNSFFKMFKIYTICTSLILLTACSNVCEPLHENVNSNGLISGLNSRTLDDAFAEVDSLLASLENPSTRTLSRKVKTVEYIKSGANTRSSTNDTLFYLINYSDNRGFALVGKSKSSKGIYAISPEGSLSMSDTTNNGGLSIFMNAAIQDAIESNTIPITGPIYDYTIGRRVSPLLPSNIAKWHQNKPYNKYYKIIDNKETCVGCGPLAVGMLCTFYEYPNVIADNPVNWDAIKNDSIDDIARLLTDLGLPRYLNAQLRESGARSITNDSVTSFFKKTGFDISNAWMYNRFSDVYHDVFDFMKKGKNNITPAPIIVSAMGCDSQGVLVGHMWIIDGFIEILKKPKVGANNLLVKWSESDPYLHCVWGWGVGFDGYYLYFIDKSEISNTASNGYSTGREYSSIRIWGGFSH